MAHLKRKYFIFNYVKYNRSQAIFYALNWWNKRNPKFYDFDDLGGDCTNFVSQCLLYGGYEMLPDKWYYSSLNYRSPSWSGVNELYAFLLTNKHQNSPRGKLVSMEEISEGDIIQMAITSEIFHHTVLVTQVSLPINPDNIFITCHTNDARNIPLSSYAYQKIRFIKLID